jgi:hypothetical protein
MKRTSLLSIGISFFCSCVLSNAIYDASRGPVLAGPAASQVVQRELEDLVDRMGGEGVEVPVAVATEEGKALEKPQDPAGQPLAEVAAWVLADGTSIDISGKISKTLGLTDGSWLPSKQKIYSDSKGTYVVTVSTKCNPTAIIFTVIAKTDEKDTQFYLTTATGQIEKVLSGKNKSLSVADKGAYAAAFEERKKYWINLAAAKLAEAKASDGNLARADSKTTK